MRHPLALLGLFFCTLHVQAQQYIYISEEGVYKLLRTNVGYTQWQMKAPDSSARVAKGLHLSAETKIVSAFMDPRDNFTIHDAFYLDLNMGILTSPQRQTVGGSAARKEGRFSYNTNFGYLFLAGYRNNHFGLLGGIDFRWRGATVGDYVMPNLNGPLLYFSRPVVLRGELATSADNPNRRLVAMLWSTTGTKRTPYQSLRVEYPMDSKGRFWICGQYTRQKATGEDNLTHNELPKTAFTQWMFGLRIGVLP